MPYSPLTPADLLLNTVQRHRRETQHQQRWREGLPEEWLPMAVCPLDFVQHREYEILAERLIGYDEEGQACFVAHSFWLTYGEDAGPADADSASAPPSPLAGKNTPALYGECLQAWRLRDERWLLRRLVVPEPKGEGRPFYAFSKTMPR